MAGKLVGRIDDIGEMGGRGETYRSCRGLNLSCNVLRGLSGMGQFKALQVRGGEGGEVW